MFGVQVWRRAGRVSSLLTAVLANADCVAQSGVVTWGGTLVDSAVLDAPVIDVAAYGNVNTLLLASGKVAFVGKNQLQGAQAQQSPLGRRLVDISGSVGLLDNGTAILLGSMGYAVPVLPPGRTYTRISSIGNLLLRSDGVVVAWGGNGYGQLSVPAVAIGQSVVGIDSNLSTSCMVLSNGSLVMWGSNQYGQCNVPTLPAGVLYVACSIGVFHTIGLRSDGEIVAFGGNHPMVIATNPWLLLVPPLPPGLHYTMCAAGGSHSVALRSDGALVAWGQNNYGQCQVPAVPAADPVVQLAAGQLHSLARLASGRVLMWGHEQFYESGIPSIPQQPGVTHRHVDAAAGAASGGMVFSDGSLATWGTASWTPMPARVRNANYTRLCMGTHHAAALRSDGAMVAWGDVQYGNVYGECNVPPLPAGVTFRDVALGLYHSVALRSDGQAVAFGDNSLGQCNVAPLPAGMSYVGVAADYYKTALVRSDGQLVLTGYDFASTWMNVPPLPAGTKYVRVATGDGATVGVRSDGVALEWVVSPGGNSVPPPPLPVGVYYVEAACADSVVILRRSDGQVVSCGYVMGQLAFLAAVPPLAQGTSYVALSGRSSNQLARVGPTCTFVATRPGCAGSLPAARVVPRDTPRIGRTLTVTLCDLPANVALLAAGLQSVAPTDLSAFGMPGCTWGSGIDAVAAITGQSGHAEWSMAIPDSEALVGVTFTMQALVLDPQSGNAMGAVVSEMSTAVVGRP